MGGELRGKERGENKLKKKKKTEQTITKTQITQSQPEKDNLNTSKSNEALKGTRKTQILPL